MSGDLISLHVLLVAAPEPDLELWLRAASASAVPIEITVRDAASAPSTLKRGDADICILDADLPETNQNVLIKVARAAPAGPLVFVAGGDAGLRLAGIDGVLKKPGNFDEARTALETCVRARIPTRVLVVDDSGTMRHIVRKILSASRFAFDIHDACEGGAALTMLSCGKFGMVFLDYNMPGLNGIDTLVQIKHDFPKVAVVLMTSTVDSVIADRAHQAGALAFLKKPFFPADIDAVVERYYGFQLPRG